MKVCSKCKLELDDICFGKCKMHKQGLSSYCLSCKRIHGKQYRKDNRNKIHISNIAYRQTNREYIKVKNKEYRERNKERIRQYSIDNKVKLRRYRRKYTNSRTKYDLNFKLANNLRGRMYHAIKHRYKSGSAVKDLGISIAEFKIYIEKQFLDGMSWENWGKVWHLDHIKPLALFDLTDRSQFLEAANWKNYQPLFCTENLSKGKKY